MEHVFWTRSYSANRIVSLHKPYIPYIHPIKRGKETRPTEFGARVNKLHVDGISFIEHLSFDAFTEGIRIQSTIDMERRYFGKCSQMGADAIYGTNANRKYCTTEHIATCFVAKGRQGKQEE
ncbi:hypothetical protein [Agriterribacter humi]|uniref:hypothetical protein n=1 Tax=Agriterribacter humi TaxID=1104781 RepID=UPI001264EEE8|nr:hypothetical protein [Agriterribacter humi]